MMRCCDVGMYKFERMAIALKWVPEFIWYCEHCQRTILEEEE